MGTLGTGTLGIKKTVKIGTQQGIGTLGTLGTGTLEIGTLGIKGTVETGTQGTVTLGNNGNPGNENTGKCTIGEKMAMAFENGNTVNGNIENTGEWETKEYCTCNVTALTGMN